MISIKAINEQSAHKLQEKDKLVAEQSDKLKSLESELEQMKTTIEENDSELKV